MTAFRLTVGSRVYQVIFMMRVCVALTLAAVLWQASCLFAAAQTEDDSVPCEAFYKRSDGSWVATQAVYLFGTKMASRVGGVFHPGQSVDGYDVAAMLDKACPNPATSPPVAVQPPQPGRVSLAKYSDPNGVIDVARLTCGHIADAPDEETGLLVAWYSGSSNGPARRRPFDIGRLRSATQNIIAYCRTHRGENLVKSIDLMAK
jgi:hypothetical protein